MRTSTFFHKVCNRMGLFAIYLKFSRGVLYHAGDLSDNHMTPENDIYLQRIYKMI